VNQEIAQTAVTAAQRDNSPLRQQPPLIGAKVRVMQEAGPADMELSTELITDDRIVSASAWTTNRN
jgi:hypothetical protein